MRWAHRAESTPEDNSLTQVVVRHSLGMHQSTLRRESQLIRTKWMRRVSVALWASMLPALSVAGKSFAYFPPGAPGYTLSNLSNTFLIEWGKSEVAIVTNGIGQREGLVSLVDGHRLVSLDESFSYPTVQRRDECGTYILRRETRQLLVRDLPKGHSQLVEFGVDAYTGGCFDGQVRPFGSTEDAGTVYRRIPMATRPSMSDIVPGLEVAGPGESNDWLPNSNPSQDVVKVTADGAVFRATGHFVKATLGEDGWWVFDMSGGPQRGYTRLEIDKSTGGETWLVSERTAGRAVRVTAQRFVKTSAAAGFGGLDGATRKWQQGLTTVPSNPWSHLLYFIHLYPAMYGNLVTHNLELGTVTSQFVPDWGFDGESVWMHRSVCGTDCVIRRTWRPLHKEGKRKHWFLEEDQWVDAAGTRPYILPRVVFWVDTGEAVPDPWRSAQLK